MPTFRSLAVLVATVALSMLGLEVVLARLLPFLLGSVSSFWAIPVTMAGLGLGAVARHLLRRPIPAAWLPRLAVAVFAVTALSLALCFLLFNDVFGLTHHKLQNPRRDALKTLVLSATFLPPFALSGLLLSAAFQLGGKAVGRLYAIDLWASASACLVVPLAMHGVDLPWVLTLLLALQAVGAATLGGRGTRLGLLAATLAIGGAAGTGHLFVERPDPATLGTRYAKGSPVRELRHRWNEVSRVALLEFDRKDGKDYRVVHDDGISNVRVRAYRHKRIGKGRLSHTAHALPFLLDTPPKNALVVFAGAGQDMIRLQESARGPLPVTGVELNGLVPWIVSADPWDDWELQAWLARDDVALVADEGRSFVDRSRQRWDLIFVASNGAQEASRTGHSRKFLDTAEAMEAYLDHLAPGGTIVFHEQPQVFRHEMFRELFEARGIGAIEPRLMHLGGYKKPNGQVDTVIVRPDGFTAAEAERLADFWRAKVRGHVHHAPGRRAHKAVQAAMKRQTGRWPTDDHPFEEPVDFAGFELWPSEQALSSQRYAMSWVKVFTAVTFSVLAGLLVAVVVAVPRGGRRLPLRWTGYFLLTGVAYMFGQLGLMGRLELLLGRPLLSVAAVLAGYLLCNGAGAAWVDRQETRGRRPTVARVALGATLAVGVTLGLATVAPPLLLGVPLAVRVIAAVVIVAPLAFAIGAFYPLGVIGVIDDAGDALVPGTFALATLSSVIGSTWATLVALQLGFSWTVAISAALYLLLAAAGSLPWPRGPAGGPTGA